MTNIHKIPIRYREFFWALNHYHYVMYLKYLEIFNPVKLNLLFGVHLPKEIQGLK